MLCLCLTSSLLIPEAWFSNLVPGSWPVIWALLVVWAGVLKSSNFLKLALSHLLPMSCLSLTPPYSISQQKVIQINSSSLIACRPSEGDLLNGGLRVCLMVIFLPSLGNAQPWCQNWQKLSNISQFSTETGYLNPLWRLHCRVIVIIMVTFTKQQAITIWHWKTLVWHEVFKHNGHCKRA